MNLLINMCYLLFLASVKILFLPNVYYTSPQLKLFVNFPSPIYIYRQFVKPGKSFSSLYYCWFQFTLLFIFLSCFGYKNVFFQHLKIAKCHLIKIYKKIKATNDDNSHQKTNLPSHILRPKGLRHWYSWLKLKYVYGVNVIISDHWFSELRSLITSYGCTLKLITTNIFEKSTILVKYIVVFKSEPNP